MAGLDLLESIYSAIVALSTPTGTPGPLLARERWVPNAFDTFGFRGDLVSASFFSTTDPTTLSASNLRAGGWAGAGYSGAAVAFLQANPVAGRPAVTRLTTGVNTGNQAGLLGLGPLTNASASARYVYVPPASFPFLGDSTKWSIEAVVSSPGIANLNIYFGAWDNVGINPGAGTAHFTGVYYASAFHANWHVFANNAGAQTLTNTGVAVAANTPTRLRAELAAGRLAGRVNGGSEIVVATNLPTVAMQPCLVIETQTTAAKEIDVEWLIDKIE